MRKIMLFFLLFFAANTDFSFADGVNDDSCKITVAPLISFLYGTINEYVFDEGKKVSQLDWDIKPMPIMRE